MSHHAQWNLIPFIKSLLIFSPTDYRKWNMALGGYISCFSHCCNQIPDRNNLRGGRMCFGSWFQRVTYLHVFGPTVRPNIMVVEANGKDYSPYGGQEIEREE
jgi:hypothetical protein